jgi:rubredoxin
LTLAVPAMNTPDTSDESNGRRAAAGRYECKVCWMVYDPAAGDPVWQIPPGTPFSELPHHWTCPNCATEQSGFLALDD